jgi:hypothetical protein
VYEWLKEIEEPIFPYKEETGDLKIQRVHSNTSLSKLSPVCQMFASVNVIFKLDFLSSFPAPNDLALNIILNEIAPHYSEVRKIFIDEKLVEINVRYLKAESEQMLNDSLSYGINPIVSDLYRNMEYNISAYPRELKYYIVIKEKIKQKVLNGTEELKEFLRCSFFAKNGLLSLIPSGWFLDDTLKESVTLQSISTFAKQIILVVNENDNRVIAIDIYG